MLVNLGFPCLGECSHASVKTTTPKNSPALKSSPRPPSPPLSSTSSPARSLSPVVLDRNLCVQISVLHHRREGIPQVAPVFLQQVSTDKCVCIWNRNLGTTCRPLCLFFVCLFAVMRFFNRTIFSADLHCSASAYLRYDFINSRWASMNTFGIKCRPIQYSSIL